MGHIHHAFYNFLVFSLNEDATLEQIFDKKSFMLKLIDWGRAIDMSFLQEHTFRGKAGTDTFDCTEMQVRFYFCKVLHIFEQTTILS